MRQLPYIASLIAADYTAVKQRLCHLQFCACRCILQAVTAKHNFVAKRYCAVAVRHVGHSKAKLHRKRFYFALVKCSIIILIPFVPQYFLIYTEIVIYTIVYGFHLVGIDYIRLADYLLNLSIFCIKHHYAAVVGRAKVRFYKAFPLRFYVVGTKGVPKLGHEADCR